MKYSGNQNRCVILEKEALETKAIPVANTTPEIVCGAGAGNVNVKGGISSLGGITRQRKRIEEDN